MKTRDEIQAEAVECIEAFRGHTVIDVSPRVGKTKIAIDYCNKSKQKNILLVYPENTLKSVWESETKKWNLSAKVTYINKVSLPKVKSFDNFDLIIVDEIHTLSPNNIKLLSKVTPHILGLSGSLSDDTLTTLRYDLNLETAFAYSIEQAINDGIISDYEINIHYTDLNTTDKYIDAGGKVKKFKTTEAEQYKYLTRSFAKFKEKELYEPFPSNIKAKNIKMAIARQRKQLLATCKTKINKAKELISEEERCIVFTAYTETADKLTKFSYHSKSKGDELDQFQAKRINKLSVINMANAGVTFVDLKTAIFHHTTTNPETAIQKALRTMNLDPKTNKKAVIHMVVVRDTVDENWVLSSIKMFNPNKIKIFL